MKAMFMLFAILISMATKAQFTKVYLQASGLTCSMCSNAINNALKTLDFVDKVDADVKSYTFEISFKPNMRIDVDKIKNKVENAGFSVSRFVAAVHFNNVRVKANRPVTIGDYTFSFVNSKDQSVNGIQRVRLLDKGFVSSREYKNSAFTQDKAVTGVYRVSL